MRAPTALPDVTDAPRAAFLAGWWPGLAVGVVLGLALAVMMGWRP